MKTWKRVKDEDVKHVWGCCSNCGTKGCVVGPDFYQENGEPICSKCGEVLPYMCTEVLMETKKCHTKRSKNELRQNLLGS